MRFEDIDLSELPPSLHGKIVKEADKWAKFQPKKRADLDYPFGLDWCKYVYWIPVIKKDIYKMVITKTHAELYYYFDHELGVDRRFFSRHYRDFLARLDWMRKNYNYSHLGEL